MRIFAGIDVHSKQCTYNLQDVDGNVIAKGEFETNAAAIAEWVKRHRLGTETVVGMETGLVTPFVARTLKSAGAENVQIINAAEVRSKARRRMQKMDTTDAFEICDGLRRGIYSSIVELPDSYTQKLREKLATRRTFVSAATRQTNAIKSSLRKAGLGHVYKTLDSEKAFARLLARTELDADLKATIEAHKRLWDAARAEIKAIEKQLDTLADEKQADIARLKTVPGVGPIVAMTALAYFSNPKRFKNAKHAASYTGLIPQTYNSADRESFGHITKQGPNELRAMLCEAAQHAARKGHPLNAAYKKLRNKRGHNLAVIAMAHRLARILWSILKNQSEFDCTRFELLDPKWAELEAERNDEEETTTHVTVQ